MILNCLLCKKTLKMSKISFNFNPSFASDLNIAFFKKRYNTGMKNEQICYTTCVFIVKTDKCVTICIFKPQQ